MISNFNRKIGGLQKKQEDSIKKFITQKPSHYSYLYKNVPFSDIQFEYFHWGICFTIYLKHETVKKYRCAFISAKLKNKYHRVRKHI